MFTKSKEDKDPTIDELIAGVIGQMQTYDAFDPKYITMNEQLQMLHKMKMAEKSNRPSADAILAVVGNLGGIVAILGFERAHVITSKALGFVMKAKV